MGERPGGSGIAPEGSPGPAAEGAAEVLVPGGQEPVLEPRDGFADEIKSICGEDVNRCYQCFKCSAGCPMTFAMDYPPARIMRLARFGEEDLVLASRTIWVCLTCNTCSIRCPNGIDIAHVIDSLRELALKRGVPPGVENVALFHRYFLDNVKKRGRTFEGELLARYQLRTGQAVKNARLGLRMLLKGRMALLPDSVKNKKDFREICRRAADKETAG